MTAPRFRNLTISPVAIRASSRARVLLFSLTRRPADQDFTVLQDPAHTDPRQIGRTAAELARQGVKRRAAIRRNLNFEPFAHGGQNTGSRRKSNALTARGREPVIQLILPMDRAILQEYLALTQGEIAAGERHIARQRELIAQLERDRHDTREATELLDQFEHLQAQHIAHRDQLRHELGL